MISDRSSQASRVLRAVIIVLALISLCCVADDVIPVLENRGKTSDEEMVQVVPSQDFLDDPAFQMFSRSGGFDACTYGQVSVVFAEEVLSPDSLGLSSVASFGSVVGFVLEGSRDQAAISIDESLRSKGWLLVNGDAALGNATYVKDGGDIGWLFVSISEVAGSVSVWIEYR